MKEKVFVGLSGGVDSAVSAALLKERGYDVTGVFIKIWQPEFIECTWKEDRLDAMRVCVALGIPFREIDLSHEYKKDVVEKMIADYQHGITPNPDVLCNRHIKFGAFATWAFREGAEMIATGHYARVKKLNGHFQLLRGVDAAKDQSYFLYRLSEEELSRLLFPVGEFPKSRVRELAERFGLPVAKKPDSQGLCFVGEVSMADFLRRFVNVASGPVVDHVGKRIGRHEGAALYTIGQRHGFDTEGATGALYVVSIDVVSNRLVASPNRDDAAQKTIHLLDVHWINAAPNMPVHVEAQARYHEKPIGTTLSHGGSALIATFDEPHLASRGQSLVLYEGDRVCGGAVIS